VSERPADQKIVKLLTRAGAWLCTTAISERTGLSATNINKRLHALVDAGNLQRREDPENNRRAQYRTAPEPAE
jgi:predicted transcriptional regulator